MEDRFTIESFADPQQLADGVAARFLSWLAENRDSRSVALSGGRITRKLFVALASDQSPARQRLLALDYFWADERCVPLDDPESNYHLAKELLFDPLTIPESQQFPFTLAETSEATAAQGETMLRDYFKTDQNVDPKFDLVFLGMGEDGHVASLFPENLERDRNQSEPCFHVMASKPPPSRMTLSYGVLQAAGEVWCVISGAGKAEILREALNGNKTLPMGCVLQDRVHTRIFTDIQL